MGIPGNLDKRTATRLVSIKGDVETMTTLWEILLGMNDAYITTVIEVPCPVCGGYAGRDALCSYCDKGKIRYDLDECEVVEDE